MSDSSDFDNSAYTTAPTEPVTTNTGRWIRQLVAILMIVALLGGTGYGVFQFMVDTYWGPDSFAAILTAVDVPDSPSDCAEIKQVNPVGVIEPTKRLCVCGQLLPDAANKDISYYLRVKDNDDKVILRQKFENQRSGKFCQALNLEKTLENGRYLLEISAAKRSEAIAWYRFTVRVGNRQA